MHPSLSFKHCPSCGTPRTPTLEKAIRCSRCDYLFYLNPALSAAGLILNQRGEMLFIVRGKAPSAGKLALVGGFVDFEETPEQALSREIVEEVGASIEEINYFAAFPNSYQYGGIVYPVIDLFFTARLHPNSAASIKDQAEVAALEWMNPMDVESDSLAFPSMRQVLSKWQQSKRHPIS